jgi:hypothetical protein
VQQFGDGSDETGLVCLGVKDAACCVSTIEVVVEAGGVMVRKAMMQWTTQVDAEAGLAYQHLLDLVSFRLI